MDINGQWHDGDDKLNKGSSLGRLWPDTWARLAIIAVVHWFKWTVPLDQFGAINSNSIAVVGTDQDKFIRLWLTTNYSTTMRLATMGLMIIQSEQCQEQLLGECAQWTCMLLTAYLLAVNHQALVDHHSSYGPLWIIIIVPCGPAGQAFNPPSVGMSNNWWTLPVRPVMESTMMDTWVLGMYGIQSGMLAGQLTVGWLVGWWHSGCVVECVRWSLAVLLTCTA